MNIFGKIPESEQLYDLRIVAAKSVPENASAQYRFFYTLGASELAPVYALYAEWLMRFSDKNEIDVFLPMMREGTIIKKFLDILRGERTFQSKRLFCSRRALYAPSISELNFKQKVDRFLSWERACPVVAFADIGLDLSMTEFGEYASFANLRENGFHSDLCDYVYANRDKILAYSAYQRRLFCNMLLELCDSRSAATVDIGFAGTSEDLIDEILEIEDIDVNLRHLILFGDKDSQIKNLAAGMKIDAWLGIAGENIELLENLMTHIRIIEALINDTCGTVMSYIRDENGHAAPVLEHDIPLAISENDFKARACQDGMEAFAYLWRDNRADYDINALLEEKDSFIRLWSRLVEKPSHEEAKQLGDIFLYDAYTVDKVPFHVRAPYPQNISPIEYLATHANDSTQWAQASVALEFPGYFETKIR